MERVEYDGYVDAVMSTEPLAAADVNRVISALTKYAKE